MLNLNPKRVTGSCLRREKARGSLEKRGRIETVPLDVRTRKGSEEPWNPE